MVKSGIGFCLFRFREVAGRVYGAGDDAADQDFAFLADDHGGRACTEHPARLATNARSIKGTCMTQMPGTARCARATLIVVGTSSVVPVVWLTVVAARFGTGALGELILGMLLLASIAFALLAVASFVIAAKFADGGNKVRVGAVVVGWVIVVGSAVALLADHGVWSAGIAVGALLTALSTREVTREWFDRPRLSSSPRRGNEGPLRSRR